MSGSSPAQAQWWRHDWGAWRALDWTGLPDWPRSAQRRVLIVAILTILVGFVLVLGWPQWLAIQASTAERRQLVAQIRTLGARTYAAADFATLEARLHRQSTAWQQRLPARFDAVAALKKVTLLAQQCGLRVIHLQAQPLQITHDHSRLPLAVQVVGSYAAGLHFLQALAQQRSVVQVDELYAEASDGMGMEVRIEMSLGFLAQLATEPSKDAR